MKTILSVSFVLIALPVFGSSLEEIAAVFSGDADRYEKVLQKAKALTHPDVIASLPMTPADCQRLGNQITGNEGNAPFQTWGMIRVGSYVATIYGAFDACNESGLQYYQTDSGKNFFGLPVASRFSLAAQIPNGTIHHTLLLDSNLRPIEYQMSRYERDSLASDYTISLDAKGDIYGHQVWGPEQAIFYVSADGADRLVASYEFEDERTTYWLKASQTDWTAFAGHLWGMPSSAVYYNEHESFAHHVLFPLHYHLYIQYTKNGQLICAKGLRQDLQSYSAAASTSEECSVVPLMPGLDFDTLTSGKATY